MNCLKCEQFFGITLNWHEEIQCNRLTFYSISENILSTHFRAVPAQLRVRMGEWNAAAATEPLPAQEFGVAKIFIHPNFNPNNLMNDVAILRLAVPVPLGQFPTITTACLPVSSFVGQRYESFSLDLIIDQYYYY